MDGGTGRLARTRRTARDPLKIEDPARPRPTAGPRPGAVDGRPMTVSTTRGAITLPVVVTEMADAVVWLPLNSPGSAVHQDLGVEVGAVVGIEAGGELR